jgi:hypothetical protein
VTALQSKVSRLRRELDALGLMTVGSASETSALRVDVDAHDGRVDTKIDHARIISREASRANTSQHSGVDTGAGKHVALGATDSREASRAHTSQHGGVDAGAGKHVALVASDSREASRANVHRDNGDNSIVQDVADTAHRVRMPEGVNMHSARSKHPGKEGMPSDSGSDIFCSETYGGNVSESRCSGNNVSIRRGGDGDAVADGGCAVVDVGDAVADGSDGDAVEEKNYDQRFRGDRDLGHIGVCVGVGAVEVETGLIQERMCQEDVDLEELD